MKSHNLPAERDASSRATSSDESNFSHASVKLLPAEVLLDANQPGARRSRAVSAGAGLAAGGPASGAGAGECVPEVVRQARSAFDL